MNIKEIRILENLIGYHFSDKTLLTQAVTHPSLDSCKLTYPHNQRLEFLGDSVLGSVLASWIFAQFPEDKEGELSKKSNARQRKSPCDHCQVNQTRKIRQGVPSEFCKETGFRDSLLEDAVEAIIGAVFLDGGYDNARKVIMMWIPFQKDP